MPTLIDGLYNLSNRIVKPVTTNPVTPKPKPIIQTNVPDTTPPAFQNNVYEQVAASLGSLTSGGNTLSFSFGGNYTVTIAKTGTVVMGTGTANAIPQLSDANTIIDSNLRMTGSNVLTLTASGTATATVPRSGIVGCANNVTFFDDGAIRCLAVKLKNKTGAASAIGRVVKAGSETSACIYSALNEDMPIGVMIEGGVADGTDTWIAIAGVAYAQYDDNVGATLGHVVYCSTEGRVASAASVPVAATHFKEIGHCLQTVAATGAGTYVNALTILHFN